MMPFEPGAPVTVRDDWPEAQGPAHIRTPHYLRGRPGTIIRAMGRFPNPEQLAFNWPAGLRELYHVAFAHDAVWDGGEPGITLMAELYEHWLEAR
jgi:hypothetical protein